MLSNLILNRSNDLYTPDAPLSVGEAIAKCKEFGSTASESSFYVKGIISSINEVSLSYENATFKPTFFNCQRLIMVLLINDSI